MIETTEPQAASATATFATQLDGVPLTGTITLVKGATPPPMVSVLSALTLSRASLMVGEAGTGTVTRTAPFDMGMIVSLTAVGATAPQTVNIVPGVGSATFPYQAAAAGAGSITATGGGASRAASVTVTPRPTPTRINVRDYGASGGGLVDDTPAIQRALAAAEAGKEVYFPAGSYLLGSGLSVQTSGVTLAGDGDATRLVHGMRQGMTVNPGVADVRVRSLSMVGSPGRWNADGNGVAHAILSNGAKNLTVEDVLLLCPGNGIYQAGAGDGAADGLVINRVRVQGWGRVGFGLGDGAVVTDCTLIQDDPKDQNHGSGHGIYLHNGCQRVVIKNTKVANARMFGLQYWAQAVGFASGPVTITDCVFQDCFAAMIIANSPGEAGRIQGLVIQRCQFVGSYAGDAVGIRQGDGIDFSDNLIHGAPNIGLSCGMWGPSDERGVLRNAVFARNRIENCAFGLIAGATAAGGGRFENCRIEGTVVSGCPRPTVIYAAPGLVVVP